MQPAVQVKHERVFPLVCGELMFVLVVLQTRVICSRVHFDEDGVHGVV